MPPWSSAKPTKHRIQQLVRWFLGVTFLFALGFYGYLVLRFEPVIAAPIDAVSPIVARLSFEPALDIGTLERLFAHPEALHWADDHIADREETNRYIALQVYRHTAVSNPEILTAAQWDSIVARLADRSTALRLFAAEVLLLTDNQSGLALLQDALTDSTPLTFIEPPLSRAEFATRMLTFYDIPTETNAAN